MGMDGNGNKESECMGLAHVYRRIAMSFLAHFFALSLYIMDMCIVP